MLKIEYSKVSLYNAVLKFQINLGKWDTGISYNIITFITILKQYEKHNKLLKVNVFQNEGHTQSYIMMQINCIQYSIVTNVPKIGIDKNYQNVIKIIYRKKKKKKSKCV